MLRPAHFSRYKDLALLFTRYGRKDFRLDFKPTDMAFAATTEEKPLEPEVADRAKAFAIALKEMGPTYVKFGQVLSTRPDIVPNEYILALESLQDDVEPFSYADVEKMIESELGARISKLFSNFDANPLAAASLAQAHRATMRDGREVVVKVQRPGIREAVASDLDVLTEMAQFLDSHTEVGKKMNFAATMQQAARILTNELNYLQEAQNTRRIKRNLAEFEELYIPNVIDDYTTTRVMTLEFLPGKKVSKIAPIELIDHDYAGLADVLTRAYLKQICVDGFWHADPHPGNVFIYEGQLLLLDFGMVNRITRELQDEIIKLLLGITENRGQDVAETCLRVGQTQEGFERDKFVRDVSELVANYHDADLRQVNTGQLIFNVISVANADEVQVPSELAMLAKTLLHLDGITRKLDPEFNPRDAIRDYAENLMTQKVLQKFQPRNFYTPLLDLNELLITLPKKLRDLVQQSSTGNLTFKVRLDQAEEFLTGMQRIANRIAVGLVIAALVIGSALLMRIPTQFTFLGYPALAILGFIGASCLGFYLVVTSLMHDRRDRLKAKTKLRS